MENTQKTADDLRKEINTLSVSKNQHQAEKEQEQKNLKDIKKDIKENKESLELAISEKEKATKGAKTATTKLESLNGDIAKAQSTLAELANKTTIAQEDISFLGKKAEKLKESMLEECESMNIKKEGYKNEIITLCDKIKESL